MTKKVKSCNRIRDQAIRRDHHNEDLSATMGSQASKTGTSPVEKERRLGTSIDSTKPVSGKSASDIAVLDPSDGSETSIKSHHADEEGGSSGLLSIQERQQEGWEKILQASTLKRYRVNVPRSMLPGDIMTIKLSGDLTKIIITTHTTCSHRPFHHDDQHEEIKNKPFSQDTPSAATTSSTVSSSSTPCSEKQGVESNFISKILVSSEAKIPAGKMLIHARPVIVIHAEFSQTNEHLKKIMVDEVMQEIIRETTSYGCNSILGWTVSIKAPRDYGDRNAGYLVKACCTPCLLMPAQILLER
jgi:hypothetical protein